ALLVAKQRTQREALAGKFFFQQAQGFAEIALLEAVDQFRSSIRRFIFRKPANAGMHMMIAEMQHGEGQLGSLASDQRAYPHGAGIERGSAGAQAAIIAPLDLVTENARA